MLSILDGWCRFQIGILWRYRGRRSPWRAGDLKSHGAILRGGRDLHLVLQAMFQDGTDEGLVNRQIRV